MEQKIQNKISAYDLQISENDKRAEIAKSYAACVISQDQVESFSNDTAFYSKSLTEAEILYGQKKISLTDRNNILIAYNNSIMQYHNAVNVFIEAKANLLYLLGEEVSDGSIDSLHLSEDIRALYAKMNPSAQGYINSNAAEGLTKTGSGLLRQSEVITLVQSRIKTSRLKMASFFFT